jgi:hypothetical protein
LFLNEDISGRKEEKLLRALSSTWRKFLVFLEGTSLNFPHRKEVLLMSGSGLTPICRIQLLLLLRSRCKNLPVPKPSNLCMFRFMIRILLLPHLTIYICLVSREAAAWLTMYASLGS